MRKRVSFILLLLLAAVLLIVFMHKTVGKLPIFMENIKYTVLALLDDTEQIDVSSLTEEQREAEVQKIYDKMVKEIGEYKTKIEFNYDCSELVFEAYNRLFNDHPEYFWILRGSSYESIETLGKTTIIFKPKILIDNDEIIKRQKKLDKALDEFFKGIPQGLSDYEKILYVHDYIINNTEYDQKSGDVDTESVKDIPEFFYKSSSVYGVFVEKSAICSGYSTAFQLAMDKLGIECGRITGFDKEDGVAHQWNYVKLDSEYYYIDLTWDDPTYFSENEEVRQTVSYDYFLITEAELSKTHEIGEDQIKPECTATKYNYYVINNLYVENYSFSAVSKIITDNIENDQITIKFASYQDMNRALDDMFERERFWNILAVKERNLKEVYSAVDEEKHTVTITFSK